MNQLNSKKRLLASLFKRTGLNAILAAVQNRAFGPHARVINYHDISSEMLESFEQQLRYFRQRYLNVGRSELDRILRGDWKEGRPGLVITFDDGLRSHAEYAAPLLENMDSRAGSSCPRNLSMLRPGNSGILPPNTPLRHWLAMTSGWR